MKKIEKILKKNNLFKGDGEMPLNLNPTMAPNVILRTTAGRPYKKRFRRIDKPTIIFQNISKNSCKKNHVVV
ncbi:MAG: hypothetical protein FWH48_08955 [Oscillospiraceae bacterium]|nr:hypothetical protein [Oscillospiraceae bacterium]